MHISVLSYQSKIYMSFFFLSQEGSRASHARNQKELYSKQSELSTFACHLSYIIFLLHLLFDPVPPEHWWTTTRLDGIYITAVRTLNPTQSKSRFHVF
jgi:hypothetical protein